MTMKAGFVSGVLIIFVLAIWFWGLAPEEKAFLLGVG